MSAKETSTVICKVCKELKTRIQDGMFDHKNKRWIDENGVLYNGRVCPSCHKAKQAENQRKKRKGV